MSKFTFIAEPGLLDELARRVEEAEKKFQAADLDLRLKELDAAKQRQVKREADIYPAPHSVVIVFHRKITFSNKFFPYS
jgi:hypothetical protein